MGGADQPHAPARGIETAAQTCVVQGPAGLAPEQQKVHGRRHLVRDLYLQISEQASRQRTLRTWGVFVDPKLNAPLISVRLSAATILQPSSSTCFRRNARGLTEAEAAVGHQLDDPCERGVGADRLASAAVLAARRRTRPATYTTRWDATRRPSGLPRLRAAPRSIRGLGRRRGSGRAARRRELAFAILAQSVSAIAPLPSYERTRSIRLAAPFCVKTRREARAYVRGGARLWLSVRSA